MSYIKQLRWKFPTLNDSSQELIENGFYNQNLVEDILGTNAYIKELGILAKAGTTFKINGSNLVMGPLERYELNGFPITSLIFPQQNNELNTHIVIDIIYEKEE